MDADAVLGFLDDETKYKAFKQTLSKLQDAPQLNLDAVQICIRLLPPQSSGSNPTYPEGPSPHEELYDLLLTRIPKEQHPNHVYRLVEVCFSNGSLAAAELDKRIHSHLSILLDQLLKAREKGETAQPEVLEQDYIHDIAAFLSFLKYSFLLPKEEYHPISINSMRFLSAFIGIDGLDSVALDTLSALLSLLRSDGPITVAQPTDSPQLWANYDHSLSRYVLSGSIVDQSLWDRLSTLGPQYFTSNSSKVFRTWFQWISQAVTDGIELECIYGDLYWDSVRAGLLHGLADQRKYCLAIIRQSLLAAKQDISTPTIYFRIDEQKLFLKAYEQYSSLFETVVLDRYINQVQACLPELTILFGSQARVSACMSTTLLAAALDPKVQGGVRKTIGNWYVNYVQEVSERLMREYQSISIFSDNEAFKKRKKSA